MVERPNNAAGPADVGVAPPDQDQARVAAFGDSLMWGQGLNRTDRFTALITRALPEILGRQQGIVAWDRSRSGAKIRDRSRSGAKIRDHRNDHSDFLDQFPSYFHNDTERQRFLDGSDDSPAIRLYGEVPAPCPTVRGQVDLMPDALGETIDVALVDGGVNDIPLEDILNPAVSSGKFIEQWDGLMRAVGHDDVLDLLGRVRRKCPNAIIMYFGFFAPLSYESSPGKIRAWFKHELGDDFGWWLNGVFGFHDVNAAIQEAMTRAVWMQGRWQYWTRQAVVDANRDATVRGPGVLFVPSGFTAENSVFAKSPWLNEDYTHPTTDPAQHERMSQCPRAPQLDAMRSIYFQLLLYRSSTDDELRDLRNKIDGPLTLRQSLMDYVERHAWDAEVQLVGRLSAEIGRIQHVQIASVGHPNAAGARSYADNAIARLKGHLAVTKSIDLDMRPGSPSPIQGTGETLDATLRRYRLRGDGSGSLHAYAGYLDVDSLAVRIVTAADSDQNFFPDVWLVITTKEANGRAGRRQYQLNFNYMRIPAFVVQNTVVSWWVVKLYPHFEPSATNRFTVDTTARLRLEEIVGCALLVGGDRLASLNAQKEYGKVWRPETVSLEVNGHEVVNIAPAGQQFGFLAALDLAYPATQPNFVPPKLAPTEIASVEPLVTQGGTAQRRAAPTQ